MEIIPYQEAYREQMISVWEKSVRATHHFVTPQEVDKLKELVKKIDFNSFIVYCLVSENKVIGFLGVEGDVIESLFLDPEYIGQKLGTRLMNFAINNLKANKVNVNEQNIEAIKFYSKFGFVTYERTEKDDYGNDYPILKMELKPEIIILKAHNDEQIPYELLLLSDESKEAINKNLDRGELFLAKHKDKIIAAFILKITEKETIEIKNIAVSESKQNKGIGTILLEFIIADAKLRGFKNLTVGTCDLCEKEISFYKKSGFIISNIRKNFFIDNYKDPIFENGVQLRDMIMLSMELNSRRA